MKKGLAVKQLKGLPKEYVKGYQMMVREKGGHVYVCSRGAAEMGASDPLALANSLLFPPLSWLGLAWEPKDSECLVWKYEMQQRC